MRLMRAAQRSAIEPEAYQWRQGRPGGRKGSKLKQAMQLPRVMSPMGILLPAGDCPQEHENADMRSTRQSGATVPTGNQSRLVSARESVDARGR